MSLRKDVKNVFVVCHLNANTNQIKQIIAGSLNKTLKDPQIKESQPRNRKILYWINEKFDKNFDYATELMNPVLRVYPNAEVIVTDSKEHIHWLHWSNFVIGGLGVAVACMGIYLAYHPPPIIPPIPPSNR